MVGIQNIMIIQTKKPFKNGTTIKRTNGKINASLIRKI